MNTARLYASLGRGVTPKINFRRWVLAHGVSMGVANDNTACRLRTEGRMYRRVRMGKKV